MGLAAGIALALAAPGTASAAEVDGPAVFWKWSTWTTSSAFTAGVEYMAEQLAEKTDGKFQLRIFYSEQLAKARENLDGLKNNAFEGAMFCNFYNPGRTPAYTVFSLPFIDLAGFDVSYHARNGLAQHPVLLEELAAWNAMPYASVNAPMYEFMGVGEAPTTLEGWEGLRLRAGGGIGEAMEILGARRQTVPASEAYTLMQRGGVDGVALPFTYAFETYQIAELGDWFTSNLGAGTSECPMVINKTAYEALPPQYQELLMSLREGASRAIYEQYQTADDRLLPEFRDAMQEIVYDDATLAEFQRVAGQPVWDAWVEANKDKFDAQGVLDELQALIAEAKAGQ
ncbi:C4-dicarboxylate ABC transporter substrate-binding protein [Oceanicola sp. 22II-s10i]|nr:C4-dicarboxylate ABC transporter substrate-binding protein [Oceanicola sp. 22II-s10i]